MKKVAIIGSGPAGLFCADRLVGHADVTVYEAGLPIEKRICPETGCYDCKICQILEGGGGAGGLSDGKNTYSLTRGTQMEEIFQNEESKWLRYIDLSMVHHAGNGIWYDPLPNPPEAFKNSPFKFESYPLRHVGSDGIRKFVANFTDYLNRKGIRIIYEAVASPHIDASSNICRGVMVNQFHISADIVIVAAGLQGIPWIENMMQRFGSPMESGPAGFGLRYETNSEVLASLHRQFYDYKIILDSPYSLGGIVMRSFCCNQDGYVLNERHTDLGIINVNGHSFLDPSKRSRSSNMAIIAKIPTELVTWMSPQRYVKTSSKGINDTVGGSAFQPLLEFMSQGGEFDDSYMTNRQSRYCKISDILKILDDKLLYAFRVFIWELNKVVPGLISEKAIIYGPEMKYYGKRANITKEWRCKDVENMYIIGSGSGYLDSFVAAALSGISAAEDIKRRC